MAQQQIIVTPDEAVELTKKMKELEKAADQAVTKAVLALILGRDAKHAFFAFLTLKLKRKAVWWCPTAATDGVHLFYNPSFIATLSADEILGLLIHEIMHCTGRHHTRRDGRNHEKWNIACDLAINCIIRDSGFRLPPDGCFPGEGMFKDLPAGEAAEWYYSRLPEGVEGDEGGEGDGEGGEGDGQSEGQGKGGRCPDPGRCGGVMDAGDKATQANSDADWQINVAQAKNQANQKGELPGQLKQLVDDIVQPKANWREALRRFVNAFAKDDFSWFPPNRRFIGSGIYMPSLRSEELGTIIVAFDTSGSIACDPELMQQFASEIEGMLTAYKCKVVIFYHDTRVAHTQEWCSTDGPLLVEPRGGGGTSHVPLFEQNIAEQILMEQVACVICLTDGYTSYPSNPPGVPVIWAMCTDEDPPWGEVIRIH